MTSPFLDNPASRGALLGLLQQAKLCPEEDAPRLVLADWLEDRGEHDRAEFIRLQCRLAPGQQALDSDLVTQLQARGQHLLEHHGGAWLGPLWRWWPSPLAWHRGLLAMRAPRHFRQEPLLEMAPWLDTLQLEVGGRLRLRRVLAAVAGLEVNHLWLDLRIPLAEATLLEELAGLAGSPSLRSLTFSWTLRLLRHHERGPGQTPLAVPNVSACFLQRLLRECPLGASLTHLGSEHPFDAEQQQVIRALGVEPAHADRRWWMHHLPASSFCARRGRSTRQTTTKGDDVEPC